MAFQLSPGVNVSEIDLTTVVPAVATTDGAFGGVFRWGPVAEKVLVSNESILADTFGKPTSFNAETFFTAANFLSYTNRLWVSRGANTSGATPRVNGTYTNSSQIVALSSTADIVAGMYVADISNTSVIDTGKSTYVLSVNSTAVILSKPVANATGTESFTFARPETTYNAVGTPSNGVVANLSNQIVKNSTHYTGAKDGTFDSDVYWIAKYPGSMGNSLRVSVCDSVNAYSSFIDPSIATTSNNKIEFRIGSTSATIKYIDKANAAVAAAVLPFTVGDRILAGNNTIGYQYLQIKSTSLNADISNTGVTLYNFNSNSSVNTTSDFIGITNNKFSNGDVVYYQVATGNTALTGLTAATNYYVVQANSTGLKLSAEPFGAPIDLVTPGLDEDGHTFVGNTSTIVINFEDPYRLHTNYVSNTVAKYWEFQNLFGVAPGQSDYVLNSGNTAALDELHMVVVDDGGLFTGTPGTVLEVYKGLSRATNAKNNDNTANYYKDVINQSSKYVWFGNDNTSAVSNSALFLTSSTNVEAGNYKFKLGEDGYSESEESVFPIVAGAYDTFQSVENSDISLVLQGRPIGSAGSTYQLANYIIDNICEIRKDCVAFISPDKSLTINNQGFETTSLKAWRDSARSSSYAVLDSGYKYQYDRYNDVYRWIPLNGDIAGLCARTDQSNDAWWSPAGFTRGQVKNLVKLAYNPNKAERDILFTNGINPVVSFPGQGTILYGDKTMLAKPSSFDRINVRRLFIVLEKAISQAAKYSLFEFNDDFTRSQFRNLVTPYLRTVQGRRGITDFLVVCDDTNNTAQIIDSNQFIGDIYIKPARSINFIQLNFVAVGTGVQFSEVVGQF
jgi:hypothetical protein